MTHIRTSAEPEARRPSWLRSYCAATSCAAMTATTRLTLLKIDYIFMYISKCTLPSRRYMLPPLANSVVCSVQIYMIEIDRLKVRPAYQTERRRYAAVCV